jgi:hypothetical protein
MRPCFSCRSTRSATKPPITSMYVLHGAYTHSCPLTIVPQCIIQLQIVKHPMDLGTITDKLEANSYSSHEEFAADMNLVFNNAMAYNPAIHNVHKAAATLKEEFEVSMKHAWMLDSRATRCVECHDFASTCPCSSSCSACMNTSRYNEWLTWKKWNGKSTNNLHWMRRPREPRR